MAINNYERVGRGLGILAQGLRPFVDHHMGPNVGWIASPRCANSMVVSTRVVQPGPPAK